MTPEENEEVVRRLLGGWHDPAVRSKLVAPDAVDHASAPGWPLRPEGLPGFVEKLLEDVPNLEAKVEDLVAAGDRVAVRLTLRGTGGRGWFGFLPADTPFRVTGLALFRVAEGRVVEHWGLLGQPTTLPPG